MADERYPYIPEDEAGKAPVDAAETGSQASGMDQQAAANVAQEADELEQTQVRPTRVTPNPTVYPQAAGQAASPAQTGYARPVQPTTTQPYAIQQPYAGQRIAPQQAPSQGYQAPQMPVYRAPQASQVPQVPEVGTYSQVLQQAAQQIPAPQTPAQQIPVQQAPAQRAAAQHVPSQGYGAPQAQHGVAYQQVPFHPVAPDTTYGQGQGQYAAQAPAYAAEQPTAQGQTYAQEQTTAQGPTYTADQPTTQRPFVRQQPTVAQEQANVAQVARREKRQHIGLRAGAMGLLGGALGALGVVGALYAGGVLGTTERVVVKDGSEAPITINASDDVTVAQAVAAKALPSVVSVHVTSQNSSGLGSGVILDTDGNVLTNYHVAGDAETISVTIGGKSYDATFVGGDASSDLAVVHADLGDDTVTPIEIGDSSALTVGDWVMTIGSPFGLDQSVSAGIVSSLARNEMMESTYGTTIYANLIQTDAAINPGNSGGALVNSRGQLVGISTLFSSDTSSFAGIGFAIPGNYAVSIAQKIIAGEQVTHAYIGLSMQTVNAQNAATNNLSVNQGAYVVEVTEGSPADEAGIKAGDIVIGMGSDEITSADGMILAVRSHSIGETVEVRVMRGEEEMTFSVTLGSDEALQALQQQQREQQQQQEQQYPYDDGYGPGDNYEDILEELYEYLYNNHGGSYEVQE